ncbi:T9SS type A sorting domain-containing protein [Polaribacter sp. Z022]|uniref:T9SS type A sorting domain-containing protein n=1 Tax=Polaribacter sp. Z022 TaxID=2927125 RepID=UPI0020207EB1|nr:T9SS type A sorting domain-containing protein [Polaribacter sp. Z022]MCL7753346.1 T9SS type A sorting domain-containing protein [Polaribacter sp. Z022]
MRKILLLFILMATCFQLNAQTIVFDGETDSDWNTATNWVGDVLPGAGNDVDLDGKTVVLSANTTVQRVYAGGSSNLTINSGVTLTIDGFAGGDDGLEIQGSASVTNNGTIAISNITGAEADGLYVKGTFDNAATGIVNISNTGEYGLYVQEGTLTNLGTITIETFGEANTNRDGIAIDDNSGTPGTINNNGGSITVTLTTGDDGVYINDGSVFNNNATLNIDLSNGTGDMALHITDQATAPLQASQFSNGASGVLTIVGSPDYAIQVDGTDDASNRATLTNSGTISVSNTSNDGIRVRRGGSVINNVGGTINITNAGDEAIQIDGEANTVFTNSGDIVLTTSGDHGMELLGTFNNLSGGTLTGVNNTDDGIRVTTGTFNNDGNIRIDGSGSEDIEVNLTGTFTNTANATFAPGSSPGDLEIRNVFDLGSSTATFEINGLTPGTEFDQILNANGTGITSTLTITNAKLHLDWGSYTPTVGDTFKIVDGSGPVSGTFASVTNSNADIIYTIDYSSNTSEVKIVVTDINSTWTGNTDTDWTKASNWSTIVPTATTDVTIPSGLSNYPTANSAVTTNSITMASGTSFIANSTVTGNVTYNRTLNYVAGNANGWHLVASPVIGQAYNNTYASDNDLATSGSKRGLATYNDANAAGLKYTYLLNDDSNAGTFTSGIGYSVKRASTGSIAFTGTLNTADVNGVTVSTAGNGFNLLGVPYTSFISSQTFLDENTNLDQTQIWVWEQGVTGGNFITMTAKADNFILAPGQGFFVKANSGTTVNFSKSNQTANTDTFKKSSRTQVKLLMNDGVTNRFAKLYYENNVTKGFDAGWEGEVFGGINNSLDVFTQLVQDNQGKNYQVQSLPLADMESTIVPIGLRASSGKELTFTVDELNLPKEINVFLEDRLTNTFTQLNVDNSEYKITLTESIDGIGRFYLHTASSVLSVGKDLSLEGVSIYKTNKSTLRIVGLQQGKTNVKIFNILGKQIMNSSFESIGVKDIAIPNTAKGIYVIQLETEAGKLNKKIILE